jgi:hypothetical protein
MSSSLLYELLQCVVVSGYDELVKVYQGDVAEPIHGAVQTVVESSKQAFCPDLSLRWDIQLPRQNRHSA